MRAGQGRGFNATPKKWGPGARPQGSMDREGNKFVWWREKTSNVKGIRHTLCAVCTAQQSLSTVFQQILDTRDAWSMRWR